MAFLPYIQYLWCEQSPYGTPLLLQEYQYTSSMMQSRKQKLLQAMQLVKDTDSMDTIKLKKNIRPGTL